MPKRKFLRRARGVRKRVFRPKRGLRKFKRRAPRNIPRALRVKGKVIPDSVLVKLPYTNQINLSTNITDRMVVWSLRGNNPGDPEYSTSLNYSAYGWSYWSKLYARCVCYASKLRVTFQSAASVQQSINLEMNRAGIMADTEPEITTTYLDRILHPRIGAWKNINSSQLGYNTQKAVKKYCSTGKAIGVPKKAPQADDDYAFPTDLSAYPLKDWYWHLWAKNKDTSSTTHVNADYTITYYCKFFDPKDDAIEPTVPPGEFDDPVDGDDLIPDVVEAQDRPTPPESEEEILSAPPEPEISINL